MDSWLSVPILYFLLICFQLSSADVDLTSSRLDSVGGTGSYNHGSDQQDIIRLMMMAARAREPSMQFRRQTWGIPFRPVRRIGSEFLGKRSDVPSFYDVEDVEKRARMGSEFLGKRRMGSEFLGKRGGVGSEFLGKRGVGSEFLGKRGVGSEFLGKRGVGSEFLGKRGVGSEFLGKRGVGSEFLGKRGVGSEFLGKRRMGSEFLGKRRLGSEFLGKREDDSLEQDYIEKLGHNYYQNYDAEGSIPEYNFLLAKRADGPKQHSYDYSWKRGRLGSEFLGKRSSMPEQSYPYLQTNSEFDLAGKENGGENKAEAKPTLTV